MEAGDRRQGRLRQTVAQQQADSNLGRAFGLFQCKLHRHHHQQGLIVNTLVKPVIHRGQPAAFDRNRRLTDTGRTPRLAPHATQHPLRQPAFDLQ
ncbi:hypothetical protein D3C80_1560570 [compost metagenome]